MPASRARSRRFATHRETRSIRESRRDAVSTIPEPEPRGYAGNLGLLFSAHAASERTALVDLYDVKRPRELSFRDLDALCNAVARGLRRAGLETGDRIAILSLNRHE